MSFPPGPAASIMPSEVPKRILRGSKLATTTMRRPTKVAQIVGRSNAGENFTLAELAHVDPQFQQLVRAGHEIRAQHLGHPQIDAQEFIDGNQIALDRRGRGQGGRIRALPAAPDCAVPVAAGSAPPAPRARRPRPSRTSAVELLGVDASHQVLVRADARRAALAASLHAKGRSSPKKLARHARRESPAARAR